MRDTFATHIIMSITLRIGLAQIIEWQLGTSGDHADGFIMTVEIFMIVGFSYLRSLVEIIPEQT